MKQLSFLLIFFLLFSCQAKGEKNKTEAKVKTITRTYFIKGMTCGGCILGVKVALGKPSKLSILASEIEVGKVSLKFVKFRKTKKIKNPKERENLKDTQESQLLASERDCEVRKLIENVTEFTVFLNQEHTLRACVD